jgi:hypothetical protein
MPLEKIQPQQAIESVKFARLLDQLRAQEQ